MKVGVYLILGLLLLGCGQEKQPLEVEVSPWRAYVLPGDGYSCSDSSSKQSGPRLVFNRINLTWDNTDDLYLTQIRISFRKSGSLTSDLSCSIDDDELDAVFGFSESGRFSSAPASAYTDSTKRVLFNQSCSLKCFGLPVDMDSSKGFTATGTVKVIGYRILGDTSQEPVSSNTSVSLTYVP